MGLSMKMRYLARMNVNEECDEDVCMYCKPRNCRGVCGAGVQVLLYIWAGAYFSRVCQSPASAEPEQINNKPVLHGLFGFAIGLLSTQGVLAFSILLLLQSYYS